ncbi:hypothetical protein GM3708_3583 (plasmid) [Geminocystis sp. NIES-3708]|uniref:MmcB family DNA repair protein n=1 Tax=Geminocystis sp. NIES-3708 TaxID=1615909 RepID=UPI0005FC70B9|nr:MmcB family DNA repair protein [Geminocystis sp. NIES-3708]BAQ63177.1 hypothetical protein GM3708_3583 [Geminocystis sp. NIES-3708]
MIDIDKLEKAEKQIEQLLITPESSWREVAKIAIAVREKELFKQSGQTSFTAWVHHIAKKCDRQPSLIWRYIKAGKYYLYTVGSKEIDEIDNAVASPEALENLEKVERNAPAPVYEKLKEQVLQGNITVKETRQIEQQYRPINGKTNRGRPTKGNEGKYEHLGLVAEEINSDSNETETETERQREISKEQIAPSIAHSLKINLVNWTKTCAEMRYPPKHYQDHTEVRINFEKKRLRIDFMAVIRWSYKRPKDVFVVEIKSSQQDFASDHKWQKYLHFCHYFCFAIPSDDLDLIKTISQTTNDKVGILLIDFKGGVRENLSYPVEVYRYPIKLKPSSVSLIYETLYERVLNWSASGSGSASASDSDSVAGGEGEGEGEKIYINE